MLDRAPARSRPCLRDQAGFVKAGDVVGDVAQRHIQSSAEFERRPTTVMGIGMHSLNNR